MQVMVDALRDLAADMPPEPIHLAEDKAQYIDRGVESDRIVSDAVLEANMEILFFDSQACVPLYFSFPFCPLVEVDLG